MAHYAWLNEDNLVVNVTVGVDETELINGLDTETFYTEATGYNIKRTSYNNKIRGIYAGVGYSYNPDEDIFVTPQPYPSWIREGSFWKSPTARPVGLKCVWDEENLMWQQLES
jgi:hypothetical protein